MVGPSFGLAQAWQVQHDRHEGTAVTAAWATVTGGAARLRVRHGHPLDNHAALECQRKALKPIFFPNLEDSLRAVLPGPLLLPDAARRHQVEHDSDAS